VPSQGSAVVFSGRAAFDGAQAILFDSTKTSDLLAEKGRITGIALRGVEIGQGSGRGASLLIYVGDLAQPRARVRIADLMRQGERPLNLAWEPDNVVRIVLDATVQEQVDLGAFELVLNFIA
jgi:hypothetical protein